MIVKDIFARANLQIKLEDAHWERFMVDLQSCYRRHVKQGTATVRALPGTATLLQALAGADGFSSSVVTGNFEVTAQVKLQAAGLAGFLCRGAYASDSEYRPDLPAIAKQRWEQFAGRAIDPEQCVIIGDTPKDLEAARQNQMKCVLVGTGRYPIEELMYWQPDGCLADLVDTQAVLAMLSSL
jgi:phosphoglycolate phosphatase-like HAD superfamily hydrolase